MPRINQLPAASSVAQTDVLAIDTPEKTYQVPRSVLAPAPFQSTIPTGQWGGSGSDYYITVQASNVTADAMLYPFYDDASSALLNGPVWCVPAAGSFTIHTSAIPSGTVTISVLLAGIVGEAQYQVLSDVYSKSQVDTIVAQSTAFYHKLLEKSTNSESYTINIPGGYRVFMVGTSSNINRCWSAVVIAYASGAVYVQEVSKGSNVTFDTSVSGKLTVNTSTSGNVTIMVFSVYPADNITIS